MEENTPTLWPEVPPAAACESTLTLPDRVMHYRAAAGHLQVTAADGQPLAAVFTVSYTACGPDEDPARPITYLFNGGPGSASLWLNVGGMGPRRPVTPAPQPTLPAPYTIEDNPYSLLAVSDLVFIDAPGTGYSVLAPGVEPARVWGVEQDAEVFTRAVLTHLGATGRWNCPRFIMGESYGTTRAALLAHRLQNRGVDINGVILLSTVLDWQAMQPAVDASYIQLLPTFAATARYHGKSIHAELSDCEFDAAATAFARGRYAAALLLADELPEQEEAAVADEMSAWIGVDASVLSARHLRLDLEDFRRELLREQGLLIGRFDTRFTAQHRYVVGDAAQDPATDDAATAGVNSAHLSAFRHHLTHEIGYRNSQIYLPLNNMVVEPNWDWDHRPPALGETLAVPNAALNLSAAMRRNPYLRVLVMSGRFDLATPYLGAVQDISHLFLGAELKKNVTFARYDSGHMAFVDASALAHMNQDLIAFYGTR